jgi:hypothetical protein
MRNPGRTPAPTKALYGWDDATLEDLVVWLDYQAGTFAGAAIKNRQFAKAGGGEIALRMADHNDACVSCCRQLIVRAELILRANRLERSKRAAKSRPAGGRGQ